MIYIYALHCPISGKPRYVGKCKNPDARLRSHVSGARSGRTKHYCANWIRCLLRDGLTPKIVIIAELPDDADWQTAEMRAIRAYRDSGHDITNMTSGGDGFHDVHPDVIAKATASRRKTFQNLAVRARFVASMIEARSAPEVRAKMSAGVARAWSDPSKAKRMRAAMNTPEELARKSAASVKMHSAPGFREGHSERMATIWGTPERRAEAGERSNTAWADHEITERRVASMKAAAAKPDTRAKILEANARIAADPASQAKKAATMAANWADPELSKARRAALSSAETKAKMSASAKARWADPKKYNAAMEAYDTEAARKNRSDAAARRSTPEYRAAQAERTRLSWEARRASTGWHWMHWCSTKPQIERRRFLNRRLINARQDGCAPQALRLGGAQGV